MTSIEYRPIQINDVASIVKLHLGELDDEFLVKFGESFLITYYKAWISSPYSFNIVAIINDDYEPDTETDPNISRDDKVNFAIPNIAGAMLSNLDPASHYKFILRHHILKLALAAGKSALSKPKFLFELVKTRGVFYTSGLIKGVLKLIKSRLRGKPKDVNLDSYKSPTATSNGYIPKDNPVETAELTHIFVVSDYRSRGIGKALVNILSAKCTDLRINKIELVTPTESEAVMFYERLNFLNLGIMKAKTGETFVRFRLEL